MNYPDDADLRGLFQADAPAEPTEAEWDAMLARIRRGVARPAVAAVRPAGRAKTILIVALAAAAALLVALTLPLLQTPPPGAVEEVVEAEAWPVTDTEDVEILSVDAADSGALVVGQLPFRGNLVLMEPGDVALRSLERSSEGEFPDVHMHQEGDSGPMIWAPLAASPAKD